MCLLDPTNCARLSSSSLVCEPAIHRLDKHTSTRDIGIAGDTQSQRAVAQLQKKSLYSCHWQILQ